jgi:protoheme ferro-lyase
MHAVLFSRKACKTLQGICKYSSGRFPLPFYCELLKNKLKTELDIEVYIGFGKPSVEDCVRDIVNRKVSRVDYICNELGVATATTCFHSQMSKRWFGTMTKPTLIEMIKQGKTRILVVSPSFVSDCIETEIEINIELKQFFWTTAAKNCNW